MRNKKLNNTSVQKILFFIDALEQGGAARVTATISNELAARGYRVYIMVNTTYQKVNYSITDNVNIVPLFSTDPYKQPKIHRYYHFFIRIRKSFKEIAPNIIIGIMPESYLFAKVCSLGLSIPVIASDHTSFSRPNLGWRQNFMRFHLYGWADAVTILTQADYDLLGKRLPKKLVMPNPLEYGIFNGKTTRKKNVLAAGRLDAWWIKGFDILIEAWVPIAKKYPDWTLEIAGSGSDESFSKLKDMSSRLGIENQIIFSGFHTDIDALMRESSIFVLSSRIEGLGMVLIEAMSQGCACISFDMNGRQREIITSTESGIIIENQSKDALETAIIRLIEDETLRESMGEHAKIEAARYSKDAIVDRWEDLFHRLLEQRN